MGLADDAVAAIRRRGGRCTVGALIESRSDIAADLRDLLARDPDDMPTSAIYAALRKNGVAPIPDTYTIRRHRRGECMCSVAA